MKTPISLALAAIFAWQAASANAGNPKPKNGAPTNSNQPIYVLVPVNGGQPSNNLMIQGPPTSPPNPTANNLVPGKGGTSKAPVTISRNGKSTQVAKAKTNSNNGRNYSVSNNGWYYYNNAWYYYYNNGWYYINQSQPSYSAQVEYTIGYDNNDTDYDTSYSNYGSTNYNDYEGNSYIEYDNGGYDSYDNGGYDGGGYDGGGYDGGGYDSYDGGGYDSYGGDGDW